MKILIDILEEHQENLEELKKLPQIGDVLEITDRDTSHKRGAVKKKVGQFKVSECLQDSRLVVTTHVKFNYVECFSYSDLLFDESITWSQV